MSAGPVGDDILKWRASMLGPIDSPYDSHVYFLEINLANYPTVIFSQDSVPYTQR